MEKKTGVPTSNGNKKQKNIWSTIYLNLSVINRIQSEIKFDIILLLCSLFLTN